MPTWAGFLCRAVVLEWGPKGTFAVAIWTQNRHIAADENAVLFSFSDRGLQEKLGIWREQRARG